MIKLSKKDQLSQKMCKQIQREMKPMIGKRIRVGDIYMDCAYHPCVAIKASVLEDVFEGISLINGTGPRGCSYRHCGVTKMRIPLAMRMRRDWDIITGPSTRSMIKAGYWKKTDDHYLVKDWEVVKIALIKYGFGKKIKVLERYL